MYNCPLFSQCFRQERAVAGSLCRPTFFRECGSVCVCPSTTPPALQLEVLLTAGGANVSNNNVSFPIYTYRIYSQTLLRVKTFVFHESFICEFSCSRGQPAFPTICKFFCAKFYIHVHVHVFAHSRKVSPAKVPGYTVC